MSNKFIAGIDEAGRGPLAGPVSVGIFVTTQEFSKKLKEVFPKLNDSKKLSALQRDNIFSLIKNLPLFGGH
ncbi:MAG: hypothetical protein WCO18_01825 [bacterium]